MWANSRIAWHFCGIKKRRNNRTQTFLSRWTTIPRYRPISILPYLGMKLGHLQEVSGVKINSNLAKGSTLSLSSLYWHQVPRYSPYLHKNLAHRQKFPRYKYAIYHKRSKLFLFYARTTVSEIQTDFQNCYIWT